MRSLVNSIVSAIVIFLLWVSPSPAEVLGDINNDNKIDLQEAVYSLQVTAGLREVAARPEVNSMDQDIALAGSGLTDHPIVEGMTAEDFHSVTMANNTGADGSDILTVRYILSQQDQCGEDPDPSDSVSASCDQLPELSVQGTVPVGSTEMTMNEELSDMPFALWGEGCYCGGITYASPKLGFNFSISTPPGYEPFHKEVLYLTIVQDTGGDDKLQNRKLTLPNGTTLMNQTMNEYPHNSIIRFFKLPSITTIRFYLTEDGKLMRQDLSADSDAVMLESGLQNLQFVFGLDKNEDGTVDEWLGDSNEDLFNDGDVPAEDKPLIRDIRIIKTLATQIGKP